jgi:rubrerythrin
MPVGARSLLDVLKCSACGYTQWKQTPAGLSCAHCGAVKPVTAERIVLN